MKVESFCNSNCFPIWNEIKDSFVSLNSVVILWRCKYKYSITLHNRTRGCRGYPLLSRRFATEGSTEASSSPLGEAPLYNAAGMGATYLATLEV